MNVLKINQITKITTSPSEKTMYPVLRGCVTLLAATLSINRDRLAADVIKRRQNTTKASYMKKYLPALWLFCILVSEVIYPVHAQTGSDQSSTSKTETVQTQSQIATASAYSDTVQIKTIEPSAAPIIMTITPTSESIPQLTVSPVPSGTLNADLLFDLVNQFRAQNGLPAFEKDSNICSIAASRAPQVYDEVYVNNDMHAGLRAMHLPYYVTENIIYYRTEQGALNWWENSPVHRQQMLWSFKYSCTACSGNACSQIFTNY